MKNPIFSSFVILFAIVTFDFSKANNTYKDTDANVTPKLILNRRSFLKYLDEEKFKIYLSSFGQNLNSHESRDHIVYKRATGRIKKIKKNPIVDVKTDQDTILPLQQAKKQGSVTPAFVKQIKAVRKIQPSQKSQNFSMGPREMIKFELEDAKYNEDYEQLRRNKKLRIKRSSAEIASEASKEDDANKPHKSKDTFTQPKEILKFVYSDAIPISQAEQIIVDQKEKSENKAKREVNHLDSTSSDTRKIKITHPLSASVRTKHVSYEELSPKMQKIVESAIHDAVTKGKATDGDYLKFYYGDKIIKVPISISKYIAIYKDKNISEYYTVKSTKYLEDEIPTERPLKLNIKNVYSKYQSFTNHDKKSFLPEKSESYVNFVTPKENSFAKIEETKPQIIAEEIPKKSIYLYNEEISQIPGPVTFKVSQSHLPEKSNLYTTILNEKPRETIPITEDFNEEKLELPLSVYPTSYVEYEDNREQKKISLHEDKNYAFGYHVSDYKTGNNFGHTQTKNNKEIKGEYKILLPDGRIQITKYFADDSGFHAAVSYQNIH